MLYRDSLEKRLDRWCDELLTNRHGFRHLAPMAIQALKSQLAAYTRYEPTELSEPTGDGGSQR